MASGEWLVMGTEPALELLAALLLDETILLLDEIAMLELLAALLLDETAMLELLATLLLDETAMLELLGREELLGVAGHVTLPPVPAS